MLPEAAAVIVAAGSGRRMGGVRKPFLNLTGEPVLLWALRPFLAHPAISSVVVVLPAEDAADPPEWLRNGRLTLIAGGAERSDSVRNGLAALPDSTRLVLVHDGARPLVRPQLVDAVLRAAAEHGGAIAAVPLTDTLKRVGDGGDVEATLSRGALWRAQTPQGFELARLKDVYARAASEGFSATDDAALFERYGMRVRVVPGDDDNLKITHPSDLALAEVLAGRTLGQEPSAAPPLNDH